MPTWTESSITYSLYNTVFRSKHLLVLPNCLWSGHEADMLMVTNKLRLIEIEIKISRSDLMADSKKDKWWHHQPWVRGTVEPDPVPRMWPPKVWKHYYCLPKSIWKDELKEKLHSTKSGILLMSESPSRGNIIGVYRHGSPNKDCLVLSPSQVVEVARLANARMWNAKLSLHSVGTRLRKANEELKKLGVSRT